MQWSVGEVQWLVMLSWGILRSHSWWCPVFVSTCLLVSFSFTICFFFFALPYNPGLICGFGTLDIVWLELLFSMVVTLVRLLLMYFVASGFDMEIRISCNWYWCHPRFDNKRWIQNLCTYSQPLCKPRVFFTAKVRAGKFGNADKGIPKHRHLNHKLSQFCGVGLKIKILVWNL